MAIKFDSGVAMQLVHNFGTLADELEANNAVIRNKYTDLGETFKDSKYLYYRENFDECDREIGRACQALRDLGSQLTLYAAKLEELS